MITGEIKNRIDGIWDTFWTGGITNSITILEQMTYLFFMKMLDDAQVKKEAAANMLGGTIKDPVFKDGFWHNPDTDKDVPYNNLRWRTFVSFEAEKMFQTISKDAFVFIKNLNEGKESAYSRFMENATFLIPNPRTLTKIVEGVSNLDMNNRDTMGDVYEYVLGKMAASGNNGQFRTPRHIIRMMVELMQPTLKDTICDPAMGSAGFIVESAKYITEHYKNELLKKEHSEHYKNELLKKEHSEHYKNDMLHGFDTDQTMLRIGAMNLMLHGVDNPDIEYKDSLSTDNTDTEKYSLCLANPPFAGSIDNEAVSKSLLAITKTKKTELLFGNSSGHKAIRKELIDHQRLQAVISMPSGVFQPYSGVSTAILVFTKTNAGGTDKVWFYDMKADGYSLDQKRDAVKENDIPDVIARFRNLEAEADRTRKEQSFLVPVEEIRNNDYDLSINKYKEVERVKVEYEKPEVVLGRIEVLQGEINEAIKEFREKYFRR